MKGTPAAIVEKKSRMKVNERAKIAVMEQQLAKLRK